MRSVPKFLRSPLAAGVLIGLLISLGILGLRGLGFLESLELAVYDVGIRWRPDDSGPDPRIVFITVTEDDIRKPGQSPLTDQVLAQTIETLSQTKGSGMPN